MESPKICLWDELAVQTIKSKGKLKIRGLLLYI